MFSGSPYAIKCDMGKSHIFHFQIKTFILIMTTHIDNIVHYSISDIDFLQLSYLVNTCVLVVLEGCVTKSNICMFFKPSLKSAYSNFIKLVGDWRKKYNKN